MDYTCLTVVREFYSTLLFVFTLNNCEKFMQHFIFTLSSQKSVSLECNNFVADLKALHNDKLKFQQNPLRGYIIIISLQYK